MTIYEYPSGMEAFNGKLKADNIKRGRQEQLQDLLGTIDLLTKQAGCTGCRHRPCPTQLPQLAKYTARSL